MNDLNIFKYVKEELTGNPVIREKIKENIFPIAVLREIPLPYIIQEASGQSGPDSKDGTYERNLQSRIYVFSDNQDETIELLSEIEKTIIEAPAKDYFPVSEKKVESWDFEEESQVFGGIIVFNIKIETL